MTLVVGQSNSEFKPPKVPNFVDLTNKRFGRLVVIKFLYCKERKCFWLCKCDCGNDKITYTWLLTGGHTKSCGCLSQELCKKRCGVNHPSWKTGRCKNNKGYIRLINPKALGYTIATKPRTMEHTAVMAEHLGRPLYEDESVHHKNGIRDDNRLENLELMICHPAGHRVSDEIKYAEEILKKYKPSVLNGDT